MFEGASYAEFMTVGGIDLMLASLENEEIGTETVVVTVTGDMDYFRCEIRVRGNESIELFFAVSEVKYPVSVGIPHNNAFEVFIVTMGVRNNNNTHNYAPEKDVINIITQVN